MTSHGPRDGAQRRRATLATISPVAGVVALVFVLVPPAGAVVGLLVASIGFGTGWQCREAPRAVVGIVLSIVAALLLVPAIAAPLVVSG